MYQIQAAMRELVGTWSTVEYEPTWTISFIVDTVSLNGTGLDNLKSAYLLGKLLGGHCDSCSSVQYQGKTKTRMLPAYVQMLDEWQVSM